MRPNLQAATLHLTFALVLSAAALFGLASDSLFFQVIGGVLGAFSQLLWFVILHECGHRTLFPKQLANDLVGHFAGFLAIIPYSIWRDVHARHHVWAGWKDVDPTTRSVAIAMPSAAKIRLINCFWRLRIPLFGLIYRLSNFWNPSMCRRGRRQGLLSIAITVLPWMIILYILWPLRIPLLLTHSLFLVFFESIMLSQHTHIPQARASGRKVQPLRHAEQVSITRSLDFPAPFALWFLLNFNEHEKHHEFPSIPGYYLHRIDGSGMRKVSWFRWWRDSRAVPGAILLFDDESRSGIRI